MSLDNKCFRCGEVEIYPHLLWECIDTRIIWDAYDEFLLEINQPQTKVTDYEDVPIRTIMIVKQIIVWVKIHQV